MQFDNNNELQFDNNNNNATTGAPQGAVYRSANSKSVCSIDHISDWLEDSG